MAVLLAYQYRDASNYKTGRRLVFDGELTEVDRATIMAKLDGFDDESFIPQQVGLDALHDQFDGLYEDDHPWHELCDLEPTDLAPNAGDWREHVARWAAVTSWDDSWTPQQAVACGASEWSACIGGDA